MRRSIHLEKYFSLKSTLELFVQKLKLTFKMLFREFSELKNYIILKLFYFITFGYKTIGCITRVRTQNFETFDIPLFGLTIYLTFVGR